MLNKIKNKKGFTLFEMLVVVAIIGILLGVLSVSFSAVSAKARDSRRLQDLSNLQKAMEQFFSLCGGYPGGASEGVVPRPYRDSVVNVAPVSSVGSPFVASTTTWGCSANIGTTILAVWPVDPGSRIQGINGDNPGVSSSDYRNYFTNGVWSTGAYCLCATLENGSGNTVAGCSTYSNDYCVRNQQ